MTILDLRLVNFRSYPALQMDFHKGMNIIVGKNAMGKTNLCEAIFMAHQGRSFRTHTVKEMVGFNKEEAYLAANIQFSDANRFVEIKINNQGNKIIRINEEPLTSQKDLKTQSPIVIFTPDEMDLIKGSPDKRRTFLDQLLMIISPIYEKHLSRYQRVLIQRNNRLKQGVDKKDKLLDVYDEQLVEHGLLLLKGRRRIIEELSPYSSQNHKSLTENKENLRLYYNTFMEIEKGENHYRNLLAKSREEDLRLGNTAIGPHRDDLSVFINDKDSRTFGSQGQQRSAVLSLKIGQLKYIENKLNDLPILILDDVFSELDEDRKNSLMDILEKTQSFITMTDAVNLDSFQTKKHRIYTIEEKKITRVEG
ncbi:MAG: DNA replication/repair protein RecF [Tissierellia bacterium]|nr:DNA replication/repair protein RecF [Tissierellia bacterium]